MVKAQVTARFKAVQKCLLNCTPGDPECVQAAVLAAAEDDVGVGGRPEAAVEALLVTGEVGHVLRVRGEDVPYLK